MTDRFNALIVTLENDMRSDDAELLMKSIAMFRGVSSVSGNVADVQAHIAFTRARKTFLSAYNKMISEIEPCERH